MGLLKKNGKVEWVNNESVYRMTKAEANAFIVFSEAEMRRHEEDIAAIEDIIEIVKKVHGIRTYKAGKDEDGYYTHKVTLALKEE